MGKVRGKDPGNLSEKEADHLAGNFRRDFLEEERGRSMRRKRRRKHTQYTCFHAPGNSRRNPVKDVASVFRENAAASLLKIPGESSKKLRESFACKSVCKRGHLDMQSFSENPVGTATILGTDFSKPLFSVSSHRNQKNKRTK